MPQSPNDSPSFVFTTHASLQWESLSQQTLENTQPSWQQQNLVTISTILLLEAHSAEMSEEDAESSARLQRMELKINLMLELLLEVLSQQQGIPDPQAIDISVDGVSWQAAVPPEDQQLILLKVYLSRRYPRPLILPARIQQASTSHCYATYLPLQEQLADKLQQLIFLFHRRQIAESRKS